jgi:hypothetical protein
MGPRSHLLNGLFTAYLKDKGINMGLSLVTRAEYKAYQGISSTTSDATIDALIVKVSELVKSLCGRTFVDYVNDAKVEYSEGGSPTIELAETPVLSVSSLEYSSDYGQTYTALTEYENYVFSKTSNNLRPILVASPPPEILGYVPYGSRSNPMFPEAINGYRVTYTAGYETLPEDLKLAILDLISYYIKNDSAVHTHKLAQPNTMQVEYVTSTNLPAHIKRILDLYTASYN